MTETLIDPELVTEYANDQLMKELVQKDREIESLKEELIANEKELKKKGEHMIEVEESKVDIILDLQAENVKLKEQIQFWERVREQLETQITLRGQRFDRMRQILTARNDGLEREKKVLQDRQFDLYSKLGKYEETIRLLWCMLILSLFVIVWIFIF